VPNTACQDILRGGNFDTADVYSGANGRAIKLYNLVDRKQGIAAS